MSYDLTDFHAAVDRWNNTQPDQRPTPAYHWWDAKASRLLNKYLTASLKKYPGSTVRAYVGMTEDGLAMLIHAVADKEGTIVGWFNESFPCPPRCG